MASLFEKRQGNRRKDTFCDTLPTELRGQCEYADCMASTTVGLEPTTLGLMGEVSLIYGTCLFLFHKFKDRFCLFLGAKIYTRSATYIRNWKKIEKSCKNLSESEHTFLLPSL